MFQIIVDLQPVERSRFVCFITELYHIYRVNAMCIKAFHRAFNHTFTQSLSRFYTSQNDLRKFSLFDIKKAAHAATLFDLWLGYLDSNQGNARFRVWCLTAWLYPNVDNIHNFNW